MKKKTLLMSLLTLITCVSLIAGGTFALFTHESKTNIAITSGKVEVVATINESKISTYSPALINLDGTIKDATNAASGLIFKNGGSVAYDATQSTLSITNITPGDKVNFNIEVANNSTVTIQYRVVISDVEGGDLNGLIFNINNVDYTGAAINSDWKFVGAQGNIENVPVSIELPATVTDYMSKTTNLSVTIEAVQGNANTETEQTPPVVIAPGTLAELQQAFADAASQATGDIVIELTQDFDAENNWEAVSPEGYNGVNNVIVNGNGHKITNLNQPLFVGSFGGSGSITINDLTIADSNITQAQYNGMGLGAFVVYSDKSGSVTLDDCHLVNSTVVCTDGYAGGLVGYVSSASTFTNCSVTDNCVIKGNKSVGAILGHGGANVTVKDCTVTDNTIEETLEGRDSAGAASIVGRISGGTLTLEGTITVIGNTIKQGAAAPAAGNIYTALGTPVTTGATLVTE